ncbi:GH3 auxin-responsive promoter [compost metagenome]
MVGEKTSSLRAQEILRQISVKDSESFLFAVKGSPSYYCAALAGEPDDTAAAISTKLESLLAESFHYRLARELGQLGPATVRILTKPMDAYVQLHLKRGMVLGNIKVESLRLISEQELKENYVCN